MIKILFLLISIIISKTTFSAITPFNLKKEEVVALLKSNGKHLIQENEIKDSPWPEITHYTIINATPLEAAAVLSYYPHQKLYVPDLIESNPVKKVTPTDTHVAYRMKVPWPLKDTRYVTGNIIKQIGPDSFEISWYLVSSESIKKTKGSAKFIPLNGKTLMEYKNFVDPDNSFAPLVTSLMKSNLKETVEAIVARIESLAKNDSDQIQKYQETFLSALKEEKL